MDCLILQAEATQLVVAHFSVSRKGTELVGAAAIELDEERTLTDALRSVAEKITGSPRVILCLPPVLFAQRAITLPITDLRKVREVLPAHLQGESAIAVEELSLQVMPSGSGKFLALWGRKSDIGEAITQFREAGIEPQIVSSLPFAYGELPGIPQDAVVCDGRTVAVIKGGKLTYFRAFSSAATAPMINTTLAALALSGEELPEKLCLIGAEVHQMDLGELSCAAELVQVPAELGGLFKNEQTFLQLAGHYAVARACFAGTLPDFRQGELSWRAGDARLRKKLLLTGILAVIIVLLVFTSKGLQYKVAVTDLASLNKSIATLYRDIFPNRNKAVDEVSEVKGEIKKLSGMETSSAHLDILKIIADAKGNSINGIFEAEIEGRTLRIKGDAGSSQSVNEFKAALTPLLATVDLGEVKSRPDGTVIFTLSGTLKEGTK